MGSPFTKLSDNELVKSVCGNNPDAIVFFFYDKFLPVFQYHILKLFPEGANIRGLVDEFFLYLHEDGWRRLKTYQPDKASLATWISVISFRFFKSYKYNKLESNGIVCVNEHYEEYAKDWISSNETGIRIDIEAAIEAIPNSRDRKIARLVFLKDAEFKTIADRFELSVDYVYTIKNRLIRQLKSRLNGYH